jgi:adenine-specific DNA-methyltransferase
MSSDPRVEIPAYASTRLIAYIGNKRALLPFLLGVFLELDEERPIASFLDPFMGSGAVSRLARSRLWRVMASDAEEYSRAVGEAWLGVSADELPGLFSGERGLDAALASLNALHPQREDRKPERGDEPYLALHYAPARTEAADWRRERLFYTAENALFLDRARGAIEARYPRGEPVDRRASAERSLLIGLLVYEAATHANTSGVFKAYHKGFGGHGRDALGRILSPMLLESPTLWPGLPAEVSRGDAAAFCASRSADLCYLDPPYNQHQYGSNYHLLNTIAVWDRKELRDERDASGALLHAAGIPESWKESRSAFCSAASAPGAFRELVSSIDARTIVLSYNTEGLVSPEELVDILSDGAQVSLRSASYVKYRGGRQSASRVSRNSEILFIARRAGGTVAQGGVEARPSQASQAEAKEELRRLAVDLRLSRALAGPFDPPALRPLCDAEGVLLFRGACAELRLATYRRLLIEDGSREAAEGLDRSDKEALASLLETALLPDNAAACAAAASLLESGLGDRRLQELALRWLRKLAYKGYEGKFRELSGRLADLAKSRPDELRKLAEELERIKELFEARLAGRSRYLSEAK